MCDVVNIDYKSQSTQRALRVPRGPSPTLETILSLSLAVKCYFGYFFFSNEITLLMVLI